MPFLLLLAGYLLGSLPFGLLVGRLYRIDIRQYGSGNIGATNVLRTLGLLPGAAVFILDTLKGTAAVLLAAHFSTSPLLIVGCGLLAVIGHSFSVFLKFQGGKGRRPGWGSCWG